MRSVAFIMSIPMMLVAGVTAYWAITDSGWWLLVTAASLLLAPEITETTHKRQEY